MKGETRTWDEDEGFEMSYETRMRMRAWDENENENAGGKDEDVGPGTLSRTFEEMRRGE